MPRPKRHKPVVKRSRYQRSKPHLDTAELNSRRYRRLVGFGERFSAYQERQAWHRHHKAKHRPIIWLKVKNWGGRRRLIGIIYRTYGLRRLSPLPLSELGSVTRTGPGRGYLTGADLFNAADLPRQDNFDREDVNEQLA